MSKLDQAKAAGMFSTGHEYKGIAREADKRISNRPNVPDLEHVAQLLAQAAASLQGEMIRELAKPTTDWTIVGDFAHLRQQVGASLVDTLTILERGDL